MVIIRFFIRAANRNTDSCLNLNLQMTKNKNGMNYYLKSVMSHFLNHSGSESGRRICCADVLIQCHRTYERKLRRIGMWNADQDKGWFWFFDLILKDNPGCASVKLLMNRYFILSA